MDSEGEWENKPPATPSLDLNDLADVDTTSTNTGDVMYNNAGTWEDYPMEVGKAIGNDGSQIQIGDIASGDYVGLSSSNGETRLYGNARQWDDVQVTVVIRNTGATTRDPTFTQWFTDGAGSRGVYVYGFTDEAVNEKELFFTVQMTHKQDPTAGIHMHVHWIGDSTADPAKVRWGLEYTWKSPYEVFGNTTIVYADTVEGGATGVTQYKHNITECTVLNPDTTQDDLSSIFIGRVFRNSSNAADTYTGGVAGLLAIDAHVLIDSFGSVDEYTKYEDLGGILLAEDSSELMTEAGYQLLEE